MPQGGNTEPEDESTCSIDCGSQKTSFSYSHAVKTAKESKAAESDEEEDMKLLHHNQTAIARSSVSVLRNQTGVFNTLSERSMSSLGYTTAYLLKKKELRKSINEKVNLYQAIYCLVKERVLTNSEVTIGKCRYPVHLMVLQSFSRMFCDMSNDLSVDLPKEKVTPRSFSLIYDWMIQDKPILPRHGLLEVLQASTFLGIPQLVNQCMFCLQNGFEEDTAAMLYVEAKILKLEHTHFELLKRVAKFFLTFVASKEFLRLPLDHLLMLIQSNHIGVNTELEVFMAATRWLNHHWPQRQEHISEVATSIRFGLIPPWLLIRLQKPDISAVEVRRIVTVTEVRQTIHDGIAYTTSRLFYGADREAFIQHLHKSNVNPPVQRSWIYDRKCSHHHRLLCKNTLDLTYETFVEYLNYLQTQHRDYWRSMEPAEASNLCFNCQAKKSDRAKPTS
ncbi:kelch-like protein 26 [Drosophila eugracilis]|uniref:kelch-like protein 26 n=1 Tax=Drosophila eugracilis TaxID=29029 RepID=UPI0007E84AC7|nr:kelch-like protein 26 [Drosophila eugracilis]